MTAAFKCLSELCCSSCSHHALVQPTVDPQHNTPLYPALLGVEMLPMYLCSGLLRLFLLACPPSSSSFPAATAAPTHNK